MWEEWKKLFGDDSCPSVSVFTWGLVGTAGVGGQRDGKFQEGKLNCVCYRVTCNMCVSACACECAFLYGYMYMCVCSSAHSCGCIADGGDTVVAF